MLRKSVIFGLVSTLAACSITPKPLTINERYRLATQTITSLFRDQPEDELRIFINYLKNQIDQQLLSEARMQLAIVDGIHWTACDIQIKNKNIYIFLMPLLSILVYLI